MILEYTLTILWGNILECTPSIFYMERFRMYAYNVFFILFFL